jgi:hypothetical protein
MFFLLLALGAGAARAEDGVRLPASTTTVRSGGAVKVVYPFGAVTVPKSEVNDAPADAPVAKGPPQAETRGRFRLTYELEEKNGRVAVRALGVRVVNRETYHVAPTGRLREHEAMHARINEREAVRIASVLKRFSSKGPLDGAERDLKIRFNKEVEKTRRLHADWDENHVFAVDPPAAGAD